MSNLAFPTPHHRYARVLSIAGSDSGGGAGIQADLKTFGALGCYGMTAITALTAQNTCGVSGIHPVPPEFLKAQLQATDGNLSVHLRKLEEAGYVAITKSFRDLKPLTSVSLTEPGRVAFLKYLGSISKLMPQSN